MMSRTTQNVSLTMPPDIVDHIDSAAREESRTRSQQVSHIVKEWLQITGESRLADLERIAAQYLSGNTGEIDMADNNLRDRKGGTELDKTLPGHGSTRVHDIYSPQRARADTPTGYASTGSLANNKDGVRVRSPHSSRKE
jgi:hypothetical protein